MENNLLEADLTTGEEKEDNLIKYCDNKIKYY